MALPFDIVIQLDCQLYVASSLMNKIDMRNPANYYLEKTSESVLELIVKVMSLNESKRRIPL